DRNPEHLGALRRIGEHREVAEDDDVRVDHRAVERLDEALRLYDLVAARGQRVTIEQPPIGIIRDEQDPRHAVGGIHVMTSSTSMAATCWAVRPTAGVRLHASRRRGYDSPSRFRG